MRKQFVGILSFCGILSLCSTSGLFAGDAPPFSYYPDIQPPEHLYVIDRAHMNHDEYLMLITLQGVLAQEKPRIYITHSAVQPAYDYWLDKMKESYGVTTETRTSALELLDEFRDEISGYILVRMNEPDVNIATSIAGIEKAVVVSQALQPQVQALDIPMVRNVTRRPPPGEEFEEYKDQFNNSLLFTAENFIVEMRDLVVASRGFIYHEVDRSEPFFDEYAIYDWVQADSPHIGWGGVDKPHEEDYVGAPGRHGLFTVPSNWMMNLSTLLGLQKDSLQQLSPGDPRRGGGGQSQPEQEEVHYLAIVMSDGDNISFVLQGMADDEKYFASPHRGDFPMNWTMPGTLIDMAPAALEWYYENAGSDYFVSGGSGAGYMYPSEYPYLKEHMDHFNEYAGRGGLPYVSMLDFPSMDEEAYHRVATVYASQPNIKGVMSVNFWSYAADAGKIVFVGDTPFVAMRENLWEGFNDPIPLAQKINNHSRDPGDPGAYTIMNVHAWSYGLSDVATLVDHLDPHVKVVTMRTLFEKVKQNIDPAPRSLPDVWFAEFFDEISGAQKANRALGFIEHGGYVGYRGFDFGEESYKTVSVRASSATQGGKIEFRLGGPAGELVGVVEIAGTGGWDDWQVFTANIGRMGGEQDLYLRFVGDDGFLFNVDWFDFQPLSVADIDLREGVELKFFGHPARDYVIQATENLNDPWSSATETIPGEGATIRRFFPFEGRDREFFRVVEE